MNPIPPNYYELYNCAGVPLPSFFMFKILDYVKHTNRPQLVHNLSVATKTWNQIVYHPLLWKQEADLLEMPIEERSIQKFKSNFLSRIQKTFKDVHGKLNIFNSIDFNNSVYHVTDNKLESSLYYFVLNKLGGGFYEPCTAKTKLALPNKFKNVEQIDWIKELTQLQTSFKTLQKIGYFVDLSERLKSITHVVKALLSFLNENFDDRHKHCAFYLGLTDHQCKDIKNCRISLLLYSEHEVEAFKTQLSKFMIL